MVATKTALSVRIDALSDADTKSAGDAPIQGIENRAKLESRLRMLEQGMGITNVRRAGVGASMNKQPGKFEMRGNGAQYNSGADSLIPSQPQPAAAAATTTATTNGSNGVHDGGEAAEANETMEVDGETIKKSKKDKKRKRDVAAEFDQEASTLESAAPAEDVSLGGGEEMRAKQLTSIDITYSARQEREETAKEGGQARERGWSFEASGGCRDWRCLSCDYCGGQHDERRCEYAAQRG